MQPDHAMTDGGVRDAAIRGRAGGIGHGSRAELDHLHELLWIVLPAEDEDVEVLRRSAADYQVAHATAGEKDFVGGRNLVPTEF